MDISVEEAEDERKADATIAVVDKLSGEEINIERSANGIGKKDNRDFTITFDAAGKNVVFDETLMSEKVTLTTGNAEPEMALDGAIYPAQQSPEVRTGTAGEY